MLYHVEAIVLRMMDYKESDSIVTLFSRESGKVSVVAKGVKKVKSKHGAACQLFTYGHYSFYKSKQLGTLRHAEISSSFYDLRASLDHAAACSYVNELVDLMVRDGEPNEPLFEQYLAALQAIESGKEARFIVQLFELKWLAAAGYEPQLKQCVECGSEQSPFLFSERAGGVLCARCKSNDMAAGAFPEPLRHLLLGMQTMDVRRLGSIELRESTLTGITRLLRRFSDYHVEHRWRARTFYDQWQTLRTSE
jgi:DNA repair protein RecO (recombination protein O)